MLVLTRRTKQVIDIVTKSGERIAVYLVRAKNGEAIIGVEAEREVLVQRREATNSRDHVAISEQRKAEPLK